MISMQRKQLEHTRDSQTFRIRKSIGSELGMKLEVYD
jgi:hypothetical protein